MYPLSISPQFCICPKNLVLLTRSAAGGFSKKELGAAGTEPGPTRGPFFRPTMQIRAQGDPVFLIDMDLR